MNIISLFNSFVNHLNNILNNNLFLYELEHNISNSTNTLNLDILRNILEYLDAIYDFIDKIFLSSDCGLWITGYDIAFPNIIFDLDKSII